MAERQTHGFVFEESIIKKFNFIKEEKYTAKWDAFSKTGIPISIKYEKEGSDIELADLYRNMQIDRDFLLIVGFWNSSKENLVSTYMLYIKQEEWKNLFDKDLAIEIKNFLENISNQHSDDEKWKIGISEFKKLWKLKTKNLVRLRFKRDHKTQKRMQCAINNSDFFSIFIPKYGVDEKWLEKQVA